MSDLSWYQYAAIALVFVWSGFVRSGLGFGGAVFALPFLLILVNDPLIWLPLISVHLLFFSALTVIQSHQKASHQQQASTINWRYLRYAFGIIIVPKMIGIFGLVTLPAELLSGIIFTIVAAYSLTYIFNRAFSSQNKALDIGFLMLGGYISGTSLIGAPLIIAVLAKHIDRHQLRDSLFVLWFVLVTIKMVAFIYVGVDLQLIHHLWLLPAAGVGHMIGLRFHDRMLQADPVLFYRYLGLILLLLSLMGLWHSFS
ncbi:TSUP family transporter [Oceanicoccus sp. KOV_DT_Chl]|uniref:TSUP family transporter n=1 Tax=Oceanicoccus sp. KOV_DT_Chl TaxID=1904639 RepID=UPI000C7DFA2F|nr:TSUP family transporter [Oceanicoccus sp. KOV_DT_Chl]